MDEVIENPAEDDPLPKKIKSVTEPIEKTLLLAKKKVEEPKWTDGLSTGSTLLNLACSGRVNVGYVRGGIYYFVGDSSSGKSMEALTSLAEAANNPKYDNYQLIYDAPEDGAQMDFSSFFGSKLAARIQPPAETKEGQGLYSTTVESFYFNVDTILKNGPAVYVLDSMDALTTTEEEDKFEEKKEAHEEGKETTGTYGTSKAKLNSGLLRVVFNRLRETGSILIIISQTRDNIGFGARYNPKTRSGGRALTFYAHIELWTSVKEHLTVTHNGKLREQGIISEVHIKKNRLTGKNRKVEIPIYHSFGIDDISSCVSYLVEEKRWPSIKGMIDAVEFDMNHKMEKLIEKIQEKGLEKQLRDLVEEVWNGIEAAVALDRKPRYQ
jgi:RecA/RadA recombinase